MRPAAATAVALTVALVWAAPAVAQEPATQTAQGKFKQARDLIADGKLDLAAQMLRQFMDTPPTDKDFLDLEAKYGPTVFQRLLRVVQWSENRDADKAARKLVDEVIARSNEVNRKVAQNPERVKKFVANLGVSPAEKDYAIDQLIPAGAAAVPELVSALRTAREPALRSGVFEAIGKLPASVVPGLLAAVTPSGDLTDDIRQGVLKAVTGRADIAQLIDRAESNPTPLLWYYAAAGGVNPQLKESAAGLLEALTGGLSRKRLAEDELVRLAQPFVARKATFTTLDGATNKVTLWVWENGLKAVAVDAAEANEYLALKYLRWAVKVNPKAEAAQLAFLAVATEGAVERAGFGAVIAADPAVFKLLAAAPDTTLSALLDQALSEGRTALAVGVLQAMSERGQKDESGTGGSPSPYVRALNDKDVRVQFAAAVALLRNPNPPGPGASARVVDVLRRALDTATDGQNAVGRVLLVDPMSGRGDRIAALFRDLGYSTEKVTTGRDLFRRVAKASDLDLIVVDRHVSDPTLTDVLSHLDADPNAGRRPVLVVASADKPKSPPLETLMLRMAVLVAATETPPAQIPPPYVYDPKFPPIQKKGQTLEQAIETARWNRIDERNAALANAAAARLKRLQRLVDAADLPASLPLAERMEVRLPQLTYGVLLAEHGVSGPNPPRPKPIDLDPTALAAGTGSKDEQSDRSAAPPDPYLVYTDLSQLIRSQQKLTEAVSKITDTGKMGRLIEQVEGQLDADSRKRAEGLLPRIMPAAFVLEAAEYRDRELEAQVAKQTKAFKRVAVIPEPFGPTGLGEDLRRVVADPAARPRTDAEKQANARTAAAYLAQIAQGAVRGYTVSDAAQADMRTALASDDLAVPLVAGLARLGSGDTQSALVRLAGTPGRPEAIRVQAADAAARHIQAFGKNTNAAAAQLVAPAAAEEKDAVLKGKLAVLARLVADKPTDLGAAVSDFAPPVRVPMPPKDPKEPKKDEPKPEK
mgnify:CR=1 FL=1